MRHCMLYHAFGIFFATSQGFKWGSPMPVQYPHCCWSVDESFSLHPNLVLTCLYCCMPFKRQFTGPHNTRHRVCNCVLFGYAGARVHPGMPAIGDPLGHTMGTLVYAYCCCMGAMHATGYTRQMHATGDMGS